MDASSSGVVTPRLWTLAAGPAGPPVARVPPPARPAPFCRALASGETWETPASAVFQEPKEPDSSTRRGVFEQGHKERSSHRSRNLKGSSKETFWLHRPEPVPLSGKGRVPVYAAGSTMVATMQPADGPHAMLTGRGLSPKHPLDHGDAARRSAFQAARDARLSSFSLNKSASQMATCLSSPT